METIINNQTIASNNWYKHWFDTSFYHQLYSNRNDTEARNFIDRLLIRLMPAESARMLDLGCGNGRHSKYLASQGFDVIGLDLSFNSIKEAKRESTNNLRFYQHDMLRPFGKDKFDYIFNFFTSFGYFKNREENNDVIRNISNALKKDGYVLIDYMNIYHTEKNLVSVEEKEIDGIAYRIDRWTDGHFFYKRIAIDDRTGAAPIVFVEKVACFGIEDFKQFFLENSLHLEGIFGNYHLGDFDPDESQRLILLAKKS